MKCFSIVLLFTLAACGPKVLTASEHLSQGSIDAAARRSVELFLDVNPEPLQATSPLNLIVVGEERFARLLPKSFPRDVTFDAFCQRSPNYVLVVVRDGFLSKWQGGALARHTLVWHELGHCLLHKKHVGDPDALMNPIPAMPTNYLDLVRMLSDI